MKSRYFLVVLFLILAVFLSGCNRGEVVTPTIDEIKIRNIIQEYCLAITNQDWSGAKSYCIQNSDIYNDICRIEDLADEAFLGDYIIEFRLTIYISDVFINGNYSQVDCWIFFEIEYPEYPDDYYSDYGHYLYLQKVGNSWKLQQRDKIQ